MSRATVLAVAGVALPLLAIGCSRPERVESGRVVVATAVDLPQVVVAGATVKPEVGAEVKVGARISGVLEELRVQVGDEVERGQVLARLDDANLRVRLRRAEAMLDRLLGEIGAAI